MASLYTIHLLFVISNPYISAELRGLHIAQAIGASCRSDLGIERNGVVVFVKEATRQLVHHSKMRGNRSVYDPLDWFCYEERKTDFGELVDVLIVPNVASQSFYKPLFSKASFAVIPHQWDYRLKTMAPQDRFRAGYIGARINCPEFWTGDRVTNGADMLCAVPRYNLHIGLNRRDGNSALLKPATKVATASAVLANILTYPDQSAIELLGEDYPYIVRGDPMESMRFAEESFGTETWRRGIETMKSVRERTSLHNIARLYRF